MEWREATERLMRCGVSLSEIADAAGLAHVTLRQMRLDPSSTGYRSPPEGWPDLLARVARSRMGELTGCADDLGALADELEAAE